MKYGTHKDPLSLVVQGRNDGKTVAYACGACGLVINDEELARHHCAERICDCGAVIEYKHYTACNKCRALRGVLRETVAAEKAAKVPWREWGGAVYCENVGPEYFADIDDLLEYLDDNRESIPTVWACKDIPITLDARSILESALEQHHEDAWDQVDEGTLQAALDAWCGEQSLVSWEPDWDLVVVMDGALP